MKKENRGGYRLNSGAKPKYNEPTKTTSFRIPISKIDEVKAVVNKMLLGYAENSTQRPASTSRQGQVRELPSEVTD